MSSAIVDDLSSEKKELIQTFVTKKQESDQLKKEVDGMKEKVLNIIYECGTKKIENKLWEISYKSSKTYEYSKELQEQIEYVEQLKKDEQQSGRATQKSNSVYPVLNFKK